jgi:ribosomal protein S18 acetylase RimI-like enzyme
MKQHKASQRRFSGGHGPRPKRKRIAPRGGTQAAEPSRDLACELCVRRYRNEDFPQLNAVWNACHIELDETDTAEAVAANLEQRANTYRIFVAAAQLVNTATEEPAGPARLVGGALITFDGHRSYIYHLAVDPSFRDAGVGRVLLETCQRQAQLWGARHMRLTSLNDGSRADAQRMYMAAGWRRRKELWVFSKDS